MIQVWVYDDNKQFVTTLEVEEILENMTTTPLEVEFYKSIFDEDNQIWYEGATAEEIEEIKRQEEANKPPVEPNEMEVRLGQIEEAVGMLATQVAKNTLLQNGGIR